MTYYIDFAGGSDSSSGASTAAPKKRHPRMAGAAWTGPSYSHAAGDIFIFKGGVTWDNTCFPLISSDAGGVGNPDTMTVDAAWYTGGAWSQPIFNLTGTLLSGSGAAADMVRLNGNYNTVNNIKFTGIRWAASGAAPTAINLGTATNIRITYCTFTDFAPTSGTQDVLNVIKGYTASPFNAGSYVGYCTFDNSANSGLWGCGVKYAETIEYCTMHDLPNGIESVSQQIRYNTIYNIKGSGDSTAHENGILAYPANNGTLYIHHNKVYGVLAGVPFSCAFNNVTAGNTGTVYCYDNLSYGHTAGAQPFAFDPALDGAGTRGTIFCYNNTGQSSGSQTVFIFPVRTSALIAVFNCYNNHGITESAALYTTGANGAAVINAGNNLLQNNATANGQGFVSGNSYAPTSTSNSTYNAGIDLSGTFTTDILGVTRPQAVLWDVGAYELLGSGGGSVISGSISISGNAKPQ